MLRSIDRQFFTDVSGQHIGRIVKCQAGQDEVRAIFLDCSTLEDGTNRLPPKRLSQTIALRCVKSQRSAGPIYTASGACTRAHFPTFYGTPKVHYFV